MENLEKLHRALRLMNIDDPSRIYEVFLDDFDQPLMKSGEWDYKNQELSINKIAQALEDLDLPEAPAERLRVLWLYYHHATSVAIHKHKDKERALYFSGKALEYQPGDSNNKITRLLYLILRERIREAEKLVSEIENYEKPTAMNIMQDYKNWF